MNYISLFDYLGKAAGPALGEDGKKIERGTVSGARSCMANQALTT